MRARVALIGMLWMLSGCADEGPIHAAADPPQATVVVPDRTAPARAPTAHDDFDDTSSGTAGGDAPTPAGALFEDLAPCPARVPGVPQPPFGLWLHSGMPLVGDVNGNEVHVEGRVIELGEGLPEELTANVEWDAHAPREDWRWIRIQRSAGEHVLVAQRVPGAELGVELDDQVEVTVHFLSAIWGVSAGMLVERDGAVRFAYLDEQTLNAPTPGDFNLAAGEMLCADDRPCGRFGEQSLRISDPEGNLIVAAPGDTIELGELKLQLFHSGITLRADCSDLGSMWIQLALSPR